MNPFVEGVQWKGVVQAVAPALATALGGPLAGAAVVAIGRALGQEAPTEESVSEALATAGPEVLVKLRQADQEFALSMRQADIRVEEVHAGDRDSARQREAKTGDSATPRALALVVIVAWVVIQYILLTTVVDPSMRELVARVLGTLDAAVMAVLFYYFGSSAGSKAKDATIQKQAEGPQG
jgi:hypothetical protein